MFDPNRRVDKTLRNHIIDVGYYMQGEKDLEKVKLNHNLSLDEVNLLIESFYIAAEDALGRKEREGFEILAKRYKEKTND